MKNPIQPLHLTEQGHIRFKQNKIVSDLLDFATERGFGLNEIASGEYSLDDHRQLAQLIGYSLSGFADLSYVDDATYETAHAMYHEGKTENEARIEYLEDVIKSLKEGLRGPMAMLFEVHEDDLRRS